MRSKILLICLAFTQCRAKTMDLKCKEIKAFVDGHNNLRKTLLRGELDGQPAASSMYTIVWDEELAEKAAKWTSRNTFRHNPDLFIASGRFRTGENLFWEGSSEKSKASVIAREACRSWAEENKDYKYGRLSENDFMQGNQIGHYTQMIWSKSTYLGCAISYYKYGGYNNYLAVCNYGPAGNFIGEYPYKKGVPNSTAELKCAFGMDCEKRYGKNCYIK